MADPNVSAEQKAVIAGMLQQMEEEEVRSETEFHLSSPSRTERPKESGLGSPRRGGSMCLSVHTKQSEFHVACEDRNTVAELKQKIAAAAIAQQVDLGSWRPDDEIWTLRHGATRLSDACETLLHYDVKHDGTIHLEGNPLASPTRSARY